MNIQNDLVLYQLDHCPFCAKVRNYLEKKSISIEMKDIEHDDAAREELIRVGGKTQVPCLFIDGKPLYESNDIIAWFESHSQ